MNTNTPISYLIELDTRGTCDFVLEGAGALWCNHLTLQCSPPLDDAPQERVEQVAAFLDNVATRPYENLAGYEQAADDARDELVQVIDRLRKNGLFEPFLHRGKIQVTIRPMLSLDSSELPSLT